MTSFVEFLNENSVDTDVVHQAMRYYLAERTQDLTPEEMRSELTATIGGKESLDNALALLAENSQLTEQAMLCFLSDAWEESNEQESIQGAVHDAKNKLPIVETGLLALIAVYGLYLHTTGGVKTAERVTKRDKDGSFVEVEKREYFGPAGPLSLIGQLLTKLLR